MQKNEAGFKMAFKKRNPEFKKPARKVPATIPATGDLRKHDNPTRALKKSHDSSSSSDDDVIEQTRKVEIENQKSEQAKLVEMALLEQVMSGKIDVMDLLKSGQVDSGSLREKLQKQMLNIDGVPSSQPIPTTAPAPAPVPISVPTPAPVPAPAQKVGQPPFNPLMRNRVDSNSEPAPAKKSKSDSRSSSKQKKKKSSGSISSESSESTSESSLDTDISSESDSDEESQKLAKTVKKLRTRNKKLKRKVKTLKKKLKEKKDSKNDKSSKKNTGQIADKSLPQKQPQQQQLQPPPQVQQTGAMAPMTPQQYTSQQSQVRRQYDPQTGQYRDVQEMPVNLPPAPPGLMPPMPPMPFGQMPAIPPGPIPTLPPSSGPLPFPSLPVVTPITPEKPTVSEDSEVRVIMGTDPLRTHGPGSDDDLYLDVFKGKEKQKPKYTPNNEQQQPMSRQQPMSHQQPVSHHQSMPRQHNQDHQIQNIATLISQIRPATLPPQQYQQVEQPMTQSMPPQNIPEQKPRPSHHERDYKESSGSESASEQNEVPQGRHQKRKSSERSEVVVRSKAAKDLIKDFYEEDQLAVLGNEDEEQVIGEPAVKPKSETPAARGVTFSGKCIFCGAYHTVNPKNENTSSLCKKGRLYLVKAKNDEKNVQQLRNTVKENTEKMVSLKNKTELMKKIIVENDVRKNERAERMAGYRQFIRSLPEPVKVSQEFGRKVVQAQSKQQNRGQAAMPTNDIPKSEPHHDQEYDDDIDGSTMPYENPPSRHEKHTPVKSRRPRNSSESQFIQERSVEISPVAIAPYGEEEYGHGRRQPQRGLPSRGPLHQRPSHGSQGGIPQTGHVQGQPQGERSHGQPQGERSQGQPQVQRGRSQGHPRGGHSQGHPQEEYRPEHLQERHPRGGNAQGGPVAPPFRDTRPPPRSGLLQTPAAGPPQRPPPAALLQTPGPGQGDKPPFRDDDQDRAPRYQKRPPPGPRYNDWSGGRAR